MSKKPQFRPATSFGLPKPGVKFVEDAREVVSQIVRAVPSVSCTHYPSTKTGYVTKLASRCAEFPSAMDLEHDKDVVEWWDQPGQIKLVYKSVGGNIVAPWTRPDKLYYHRDKGWVIREDKHPAKICAEAAKSPNRYVRDETGRWTCPPGIEAARAYGMSYEVYVPDAADAVFFRNASFLEDYFIQESSEVEGGELAADAKIAARLREKGGFGRVCDLIETDEEYAILYRAIATGDLFVNLRRDLLCYPSKTWVYLDEATAVAVQHIHGSKATAPIDFHLAEGTVLEWQSRQWTVLEVTKHMVSVRSSDGEFNTLSRVQLLEGVDRGGIRQVRTDAPNDASLDLLRCVSPTDLEEANRRKIAVDLFRRSRPDAISQFSLRTLQRWARNYRIAETQLGCGYLGLIPKRRLQGNRQVRIPADRSKGLEDSLQTDFLSDEAMTLYQAYAAYVGRCRNDGEIPVSYPSYRRKALRLDVVERVEARSGKRASYQRKAPLPKSAIPPHGDRPWEVAHLDHTRSNIVLRSAVTGEVIGNPWMTLLIDANTRYPLARYYSFSRPSKVAVMMVMRDCVYRNNRLPQRIVVDQGAEFNSIYFDTFCAAYLISKTSRPASEARFGSIGERINGTIDTKFLSLLKGNSHRMKNPRSVSESHNPRNTAVWTPGAYIKQYDKFLFELYPQFKHKEILEAPAARYQRLQKQAGERASRFIPFDSRFLVLTMLDPARGVRTVQNHGVSINNLRYWSDELKPYVRNGKDYPVKYDPMDFWYTYILIDGHWVRMECTSPLVAEYSEQGIDDGLVELMARAREVGREYLSVPEAYAQFVLDTKRNEEILAAQLSENDTHEAEEDSHLDDFDDLDDGEVFDTTVDMEDAA